MSCVQRWTYPAALTAIATLCVVLYLLSISDTDDREWLAWRRVYTTDELQAVWDSRHKDPLLLLVVVGKVYDVSAGRTYYGEDGASYEGFASGFDHSRAFLTADFDHNATDDLSGLSHGEYLGVQHWCDFYEQHAKYSFAGVLDGRYYDARGRKRPARYEYESNVAAARVEREVHISRMLAAPRCTVATAAAETRRGVWKTMSCEPPHVPRWAILGDAGKLCLCLPYNEADNADPEEQEMPHRYRACTPNSTECTTRTG